jgi:hypothetical protein
MSWVGVLDRKKDLSDIDQLFHKWFGCCHRSGRSENRVHFIKHEVILKKALE